MTPKTIDARGRSCPEPVLLTKKALEQHPAGIEVILDSTVSRDNVKRFAENTGYKVAVSQDDKRYVLTISR